MNQPGVFLILNLIQKDRYKVRFETTRHPPCILQMCVSPCLQLRCKVRVVFVFYRDSGRSSNKSDATESTIKSSCTRTV